MKTKELEVDFTAKGFVHRRIVRDGDLAVYMRWHEHEAVKPHFEVIVVQRGSPYPGSANDGVWDEVETYPSSQTWGDKGWTYATEAEALDKFRGLIQRREQPVDRFRHRQRGRAR